MRVLALRSVSVPPLPTKAAAPPVAMSVSMILRRAARSRVRLKDCAPVLQQLASDACPSLNQCAPETTLDCASGCSSLRAATATSLLRRTLCQMPRDGLEQLPASDR